MSAKRLGRTDVYVRPEQIERSIYVLRGQRAMLDEDLARLYRVRTSALTQAVKRNIERFPEDFAFQLTNQEFHDLKSQIVTSSWGGVESPLGRLQSTASPCLAVFSARRSPRE
jgi:ORF6N domain